MFNPSESYNSDYFELYEEDYLLSQEYACRHFEEFEQSEDHSDVLPFLPHIPVIYRKLQFAPLPF
jgi:hypothetical protein